MWQVVTCGSVPLESSYQRVSRCVYTSTGLYEYRNYSSKKARENHRRYTWGLRHREVCYLDAEGPARVLIYRSLNKHALLEKYLWRSSIVASLYVCDCNWGILFFPSFSLIRSFSDVLSLEIHLYLLKISWHSWIQTFDVLVAEICCWFLHFRLSDRPQSLGESWLWSSSDFLCCRKYNSGSPSNAEGYSNRFFTMVDRTKPLRRRSCNATEGRVWETSTI